MVNQVLYIRTLFCKFLPFLLTLVDSCLPLDNTTSPGGFQGEAILLLTISFPPGESPASLKLLGLAAHCPSQPAIPPPAHRGQVLERKSCGRSAILGKKLQFLVQTPLSKNSCLIAAQLRQKAFSSESFSHYWVEKCPVGQGGWRM